MTTTETLTPGATVALVTGSTPEWLEYGNYYGWVELDEHGCYLRDLAQSTVADADIAWNTPHDQDYERVGIAR